MGRPGSDTYDTIVIGAGPAGVMAALRASAAGHVLLADAAPLPRNKSCGGMLHELTQDFLREWGGVPENIVVEPRSVAFRYVDWDRDIRKVTDLSFVNVDRAGFDEWLLSLLPESVEVLGGAKLAGVTQDGEGVIARFGSGNDATEVHCSFLVGADGARSTVRRALGSGTAAAYVTLQDFVSLSGDLPPYFDCIYMRDVGAGFGYGYLVPKGDLAIVGSVFYPKTKRPSELQDRLLDTLRSRIPALGPSVRREACAALYVRSMADVVPGSGRVLLAGEAGGFMSPTSGEGISYALRSGSLAGAAIADAGSDALPAYAASIAPLAADIRRRLRWLPLMESRAGKYLAGSTPASIVSRVTRGL